MAALAEADGTFTACNDALAKSLGKKKEELVGKPMFEYLSAEAAERRKTLLQGMVASKKPLQWDDEHAGRHFDNSVYPILDGNGNVKQLALFAKDITERVQAKEALSSEKQRIAYILQGTNVGTWEWNVQTGETTFNERWAEIVGCTLEEISPVSIDTWMKYTHPDDLKMSGELLKEHVNGELDYYECEARMRHKNGDWIWVLTRGKVATWTEDGKPLLMSGTHLDITDLKQAEEALRKSEAHLSALIQMLPDLVWLKDADGVYLSCNHRVECLFGAKEDEIVGKTDYDFVDKELADFLRENDRAALAAGTVSVNEEEIAFADDGHVEILETLKTPMYDSEGNLIGVLGISRDITDHKQTEEVLRKSEERFRTVADFTHGWEYWVAPDGHYAYVSPSCERITGYTPDELINDPGLLEKIVHPDDHSEIVKHRAGVRNLEKLPSCEFRIVTRSGEERWIDHVCQVVYGADGTYLGRRGSNRDITKQKKMQEELLKAKKLESVGVLAGGIAHDFNNLMSVVMGNISLARTEMRPGSKGFKNLVEAEKASIQTTALTSRLITFSKGGGPVKEPVSIGDLVKKSVNSSLKGSDISCIFSVPEDILPVEVDEEQMKQVIHNITTNAQEAMAEQGTINVSCGNVIIGEKDTLNLRMANMSRFP